MLGEGTESRIFIPEGLPHGCGSMHHTVRRMSEKRGLEYVRKVGLGVKIGDVNCGSSGRKRRWLPC